MKSLEQLVDEGQGAWLRIQDWLTECNTNKLRTEILPAQREAGEQLLLKLQVTTGSYLGTVAYRTGGILVDSGWLRILGAGHDRLKRDISSWNGVEPGGHERRLDNALLIADDVVGGFYAINGGAFEAAIGKVGYFAPDSLEWEDLNFSYGDFLCWAMTGDLNRFYQSYRWPEWERDITQLDSDHAFSIYPPPWTDGPSISERSRKAVPIAELWALGLEYSKMLNE